MAATTSSGSCAAFFNVRSHGGATTAAAKSRSPGCGRVDGVVMWIVNGVAAAFFASLDRCSCIRIATVDDHDGDDTGDLPLIFNDGNTASSSSSSSSSSSRRSSGGRRIKGKGKKNAAILNTY